MDWVLFLGASFGGLLLFKGWKLWPVKLLPVREAFRLHGEAELFRRDGLSGLLVATGVVLNS